MKPILFSTPMVQAILDGRKNMTRRVVKPQPRPENSYFGGEVISSTDKNLIGCVGFCRSALAISDHDYARPKYQPGDVLWVRETWAKPEDVANYHFDPELKPGEHLMKADMTNPTDITIKWRPSIFMPKTAARIWLRVNDVRVERVQDITEEDAENEGISAVHHLKGGYHSARENFSNLWDSLNAKRGYGWDTNPWVWVISFERCEKPGDEQ